MGRRSRTPADVTVMVEVIEVGCTILTKVIAHDPSAECDHGHRSTRAESRPPRRRLIDTVTTHGASSRAQAKRRRARIHMPETRLPHRGDGVISATVAGHELGERRNLVLRRLRDVVATQYGLHPSALAPLGEQTLTTMAEHVEQGLVRVTVFRVEGSVTNPPPGGSPSHARL
jgi:hypothetical protein